MLYRIVVILLLSILIGLVAWDVSARKAAPEDRINSPNFTWVKCPSCERMFYVEKGHRQGWCPYDGLQFDFSTTQ
ncbi:MAG: hypothetical protein C4532_19330 [Candidatus Abyssobacteria bacterium SURF_17]|uniref:Uncharacterized protein n=1 Tax=Candidatus Abyssobacteria bacterium SURF_17 TaxID=2093361 RepID=A0A419ENQ7_9BACT|nr:MAG: hypothetical protein C4532_19330 [Candidatus Abyssubacteria bacterium SURF_17]